MKNAATGRAKRVLKWPAEPGELAQNTKKILIRRNEPKVLVKIKDLAFSDPQNELSFEFKKCQSKPKIWPKIDELWSVERTRNWKLETWPASFQFLISSFCLVWMEPESRKQKTVLPVSSFQFPVSAFPEVCRN